MHGRFEKEWIPPWWKRQQYESKTTGGKPEFEEYQPPAAPEQMSLKLEKEQRENIQKLAAEFDKLLSDVGFGREGHKIT